MHDVEIFRMSFEDYDDYLTRLTQPHPTIAPIFTATTTLPDLSRPPPAIVPPDFSRPPPSSTSPFTLPDTTQPPPSFYPTWVPDLSQPPPSVSAQTSTFLSGDYDDSMYIPSTDASVPVYDTTTPNPLDRPGFECCPCYGAGSNQGTPFSEIIVSFAGLLLAFREMDKILKEIFKQAVYMSDPRLIQSGLREEGMVTSAWNATSRGLQQVWIPLWWSGNHLRNEQVAAALREAELSNDLDRIYQGTGGPLYVRRATATSQPAAPSSQDEQSSQNRLA